MIATANLVASPLAAYPVMQHCTYEATNSFCFARGLLNKVNHLWAIREGNLDSNLESGDFSSRRLFGTG